VSREKRDVVSEPDAIDLGGNSEHNVVLSMASA
jgi:hypothetical protein